MICYVCENIDFEDLANILRTHHQCHFQIEWVLIDELLYVGIYLMLQFHGQYYALVQSKVK